MKRQQRSFLPKAKNLKSQTYNLKTKEQFTGPVILSNIVSSQIDLHKKTGGVVPEVASRAHMEAIIPVIKQALLQANPKSEILNSKQIRNSKNKNSKHVSDFDIRASDLLQDVTHLAVTAGPGLIGSLLVGFNTAKSIAYSLNLPIIPINHIEGHIYSAIGGECQMSNVKCQKYGINHDYNPNKLQANKLKSFPILALTVSGGHTSLNLIFDHGKYKTIGATRDDAAGEAFDKVARLLDLGYPGGPIVSKFAAQFRESQISNLKPQTLILPRPMIRDKNFDFSFSGLKTAVLEEITNHKSQITKKEYKMKVCAAFEDAAVDVLVTKTIRAAKQFRPKGIILAGGVAANKSLQQELKNKIENYNLEVKESDKMNYYLPPADMTGDNAAMIGLAACYHIVRGDVKRWSEINLDSNLKL